MQQNYRKLFMTLSVLLMYSLASIVCLAAEREYQEISLSEALNLAFLQNTNYQLALWEHDLQLQEQALTQKRLPTINLATKPISISNGDMQPATSSIDVNMPLSDHMTLSGKLQLALSEQAVKFDRNVTIAFDYSLFAPPQATSVQDADSLLIINNSLVLEVVQKLISLRKQHDDLAIELYRLEYLQQAYLAAQVKDNLIQAQQILQQVHTTNSKITELNLAINQFNYELASLINQNGYYLPIIPNLECSIEFSEEELINHALAASQEWKQALHNLELAQQQLKASKQSAGWQVNANASVSWDMDLTHDPNWSVALTASKSLYPPSLQQEKYELQLAKAQLRAAEIENSIRKQVQQQLQRLELLAEQYIQLQADLTEEQNNMKISQKHLQAGLVTELKLMEHQLNLYVLEKQCQHNRYDYLSAWLQLMHQCGFDLQETIFDSFARVGVNP